MIKINWGTWYYTFGTSGKEKWSNGLEEKRKQFNFAERQDTAS